MARRFRAIIAEEGVETGDGRIFDDGALRWRVPPLTLMAQTSNPEFGGHNGAFVIGRIDTIERSGSTISAEGELDDEGEGEAADMRRDVVRWVENGTLNGISVDPGAVEVDYECLEYDEDEYGAYCVRELVHFTDYEIAAATIVNIPALSGTLIELLDAAVEAAAGEEAEETEAVTAAVTVPELPPADWFDDPLLNAPTPLTVTDDGRVFGHIATWGTCHIGYEARCVEPPRSLAGYAYFRTGSRAVACDDCPRAEVPTGAITLGGGHADLPLDARAAAAHYDDAGAAVADVAAGEDAYGVWVAGALRPGVTEAQVTALRASSPSGDWRAIGGSLELVAVLAVNVPGFPVPRARTASGRPQTLVAAGALLRRGRPTVEARQRTATSQTRTELRDRLDRVETDVRTLRSLFSRDEIAERLAARLGR